MTSYLYNIIEKEKLQDMLKTFYYCIDLPVQLIDSQGKILESVGGAFSFCSRLQPYFPSHNQCAALHMKAAERAWAMGEAYIFACHSNLNHIIFPLVNKNTLLGAILVGPFLMDKPDSLLISDLGQRYSIPMDSLLEIYEGLSTLPVVSPAKVTHISHFLYYIFSNLNSESFQMFSMNQKKLHQQSLINESIQNYKKYSSDQPMDYPFEKEKELIGYVKIRDINNAKVLLNDLLGYVFFAEGNNLTTTKNRVVELCTLISRAAVEGGAVRHITLKINNSFLEKIEKIETIDELCYSIQETLDDFMQTMFEFVPNKHQDIIKRSVAYISKHFSEKIGLNDVAAHVHLNPTYFSSIFKQSIGVSFKEYLNMIRVEEGKRLLANTDYSIIDIAIAIGFEDQSYFSRIFKKYTGFTPNTYRK